MSTHYPRSGRRRPCFVYFARAGQYLKVGCSSNPPVRVKMLRHQYKGNFPADLDRSQPFEILRVIPGGFDLEFYLQNRLYDFHVAGEWFQATPEVLEWVSEIDTLAPTG